MDAGEEKEAELRTLKILKNPNVSVFSEGTSRESCVIQNIKFYELKHSNQSKPGSDAVCKEEVEEWKKLQALMLAAEPKLSQRKVCDNIAEHLKETNKKTRSSETIRDHLYKKT